ncbi:STAS-like domain-containing protein [Haemophilus parahaemolyticus]|uniref:STAS-like domain-containing protein n=1 Tax=Haemophilus parahaemolyticus TaxID=735 RepID=UPI0024910ED0|nr:STAS-like domain-containing protein [Haemophilus parahaemolyticus]
MLIKVAEFSKTPYGRTDEDGAFNGKRFRLQKLKPAFEGKEDVTIDFHDIAPPGSSFLHEAFGGLIRYENMTLSEILKKLRIISNFPLYEIQIKKFLEEEENDRLQREA